MKIAWMMMLVLSTITVASGGVGVFVVDSLAILQSEPRDAPLLAQALARGELSYAKVRALTRVATPETEARLLGVGRGGTAAHVERIVRGWRCIDRKAEARETKRQHASRALHVHQDEDGGPGAPRAARRAGAPLARADGVPVLAGRAPGSGLRARRPASAGQPTPGIVKARGRPAFDGMIDRFRA
jgi:hypothetical protein